MSTGDVSVYSWII